MNPEALPQARNDTAPLAQHNSGELARLRSPGVTYGI